MYNVNKKIEKDILRFLTQLKSAFICNQYNFEDIRKLPRIMNYKRNDKPFVDQYVSVSL